MLRDPAHARLERDLLRAGAILDAALDSIIAFDLNGRITEFNAAAQRMFGLTRAVKARARGVEAVLAKPYQLAELLRALSLTSRVA